MIWVHLVSFLEHIYEFINLELSITSLLLVFFANFTIVYHPMGSKWLTHRQDTVFTHVQWMSTSNRGPDQCRICKGKNIDLSLPNVVW